MVSWCDFALDCGCNLTTETVQGATLAFQGVHDIHGGHGLPLSVFSVGDGVADHVLEEHLQHATGLLVDQTGDSLHATTTGQTTDCRLGDTLDVITKDLAVTLGASLTQSLASLATASHLLLTMHTTVMPSPESNRKKSSDRGERGLGQE